MQIKDRWSTGVAPQLLCPPLESFFFLLFHLHEPEDDDLIRSGCEEVGGGACPSIWCGCHCSYESVFFCYAERGRERESRVESCCARVFKKNKRTKKRVLVAVFYFYSWGWVFLGCWCCFRVLWCWDGMGRRGMNQRVRNKRRAGEPVG